MKLIKKYTRYFPKATIPCGIGVKDISISTNFKAHLCPAEITELVKILQLLLDFFRQLCADHDC